MAHAGPLRPDPTEPTSNLTGAIDDMSAVWTELLQDIENFSTSITEQYSDHFRELRQEIAKLQQDIPKESTFFTDHYGDGAERFRLETAAMRMMEQKQEEMEERFDDRCGKMEETQCRILEALKGLSDSQENSIVSAASKALKMLSASLLRHGENLSAVTKEPPARIANFFTCSTRLFPSGPIPTLTKLHTLPSILKAHWQAASHLDSTMSAAYPWLSFAMASCYHLPLSAWSVQSTLSLYQRYTVDFGYDGTVSYLIFWVVVVCFHTAVTYTLGGGGKRSAVVKALLLWAGPKVVFRA
ncbi:MAG: hypothetical protein ASARMPRED_000315 [Alectoria sarmentosa]|nr:MAG: hypothetical protein ASARMPRED_000315 [Alectoria sarmentosa]